MTNQHDFIIQIYYFFQGKKTSKFFVKKIFLTLCWQLIKVNTDSFSVSDGKFNQNHLDIKSETLQFFKEY